MVNRTVVGENQIPMLRHTLQKEKRKKDRKLGYKLLTNMPNNNA